MVGEPVEKRRRHLASPNTVGYPAKARLVVTMIEVRS
jgi:hypothetical protein